MIKELIMPIEWWKQVSRLSPKWRRYVEEKTNSVKGCIAKGLKQLK